MKMNKTILISLLSLVFIILIFLIQVFIASFFAFNAVPQNAASNIEITLSIIPFYSNENITANDNPSGIFDTFINFEYYFIIFLILFITIGIYIYKIAGLKNSLKLNGYIFSSTGFFIFLLMIFISVFYNTQAVIDNIENALESVMIISNTAKGMGFENFTSSLRNTGLAFSIIGIALIFMGNTIKLKRKKRKSKLKKKKPVKSGIKKTEKKKKQKKQKKKSVKNNKKTGKKIVKKDVEVMLPFNTYSSELSYVFVSYAHKDMNAVYKIINTLNKNGHRIWYDEGIEPGKDWTEVIGNRIIGCSQFLLCISPDAVNSRNVRNEINLAVSENKEIVIIHLKNTKLTGGLKLQIGSVQHINKYNLNNKLFFEKLESTIKA